MVSQHKLGQTDTSAVSPSTHASSTSPIISLDSLWRIWAYWVCCKSFSITRVLEMGHHIVKPETLGELREGQHGVLESIDLSADASRRLMELGFLPGSVITGSRSAPGGDPLVFRVDGSEVALRRETAERLILRASEVSGD
jgi:ferrous iron transport protein A